MGERLVKGLPASPGTAAGSAQVIEPAWAAVAGTVPEAERALEAERAATGLRAAAAELEGLAERLRREGRGEDAEIVSTGALMAADPSLHAAVSERSLEGGLSAPAALLAAADQHADLIAALDDPLLAARAADVRSLGRRAARLAAPAGTLDAAAGDGPAVLVARDLGPADVAELSPNVVGIALAAGGVTAHAAIVARSLGLPMAVGLGEGLLSLEPGARLVLDGGAGTATLDPDASRLAAAEADAEARARARARALRDSGLPATTRDGHRVQVLVNAATAVEVLAGLEAGADGAGLIRTELSFLEAARWPSEEEHRRTLEPVLAPLRGKPATVRLLDFGGDKTPPFLRGEEARGIGLLLRHPDALAAQVRAIAAAAGENEIRLLLPMASRPEELSAVRSLLEDGDGIRAAVGAMVETAEAVARAAELAAGADFLSIGTNDLTCSVLGQDRFSAGGASAHDPRVLRAIADTARAACEAGVPVEVCGEAASQPLAAPILIGLGVDELSVGANRVGAVRAWVRALTLEDCERLAARALRAETVEQVEEAGGALARRLELAERGDAAGKRLERPGGVLPVGPQP